MKEKNLEKKESIIKLGIFFFGCIGRVLGGLFSIEFKNGFLLMRILGCICL